jgi:hypothetical protein
MFACMKVVDVHIRSVPQWWAGRASGDRHRRVIFSYAASFEEPSIVADGSMRRVHIPAHRERGFQGNVNVDSSGT